MTVFHEIYSVYYNAVAKILTASFETPLSEKSLQELINKEAFSESFLKIISALKSEEWPLLDKNGKSVLSHKPTMPLSILQKRFLKSVLLDPKMKLFTDTEKLAQDFSDIEPLFTGEDILYFDQYDDGDSFENEEYIANFRTIYKAIKEKKAVCFIMENRYGKEIKGSFIPKCFEYSIKDNKIRVIVDGFRYSHVNLARIHSCEISKEDKEFKSTPVNTNHRELKLFINDERNALERVLLHFAHFEKETEQIDEKKYIVKIIYHESDETEVLIRVLSFGPLVKVLAPDSFICLIKERLQRQKSFLQF